MKNNYVSITDKNNELRFYTYENDDSLSILISSGIIKKTKPISIDADNGTYTDDTDELLRQAVDPVDLATMTTYQLNKLTFNNNGNEIVELLAEYQIFPADVE